MYYDNVLSALINPLNLHSNLVSQALLLLDYKTVASTLLLQPQN